MLVKAAISRRMRRAVILALAGMLLSAYPAAAENGKAGRGDTISLSAEEADDWRLLPVYSLHGKRLGKVAEVVLGEDGRITKLHVATEFRNDDIEIAADQFSVVGGRIALHLDQGQFFEMVFAEPRAK